MSRITVSGTVDAPREVVWEFLTDFGRIPEYSALVDEVEDLSTDPVEAGAGYREVRTVGPVKLEAEWEVVEVSHPHRLVLHGESPLGDVTVAYRLASVDGRTRVEQLTVYDLAPGEGSLVEFLDWALVHRLVARHLVRTLEEFVGLVEREYGREIPIE